MPDVTLNFNHDINVSVQIGDILYHETPSRTLEDNILDVNVFSATTIDLTGSGNDGYIIINDTTVTWLPTVNTPSGLNYFNNLTTENITTGDTYLVTLEVSNYNGTGTLGFSSSGGLGSDVRVDQNNVDASGYAKITKYFIATTDSKPDFFARSTNSGTIKGSIQKVVPGEMLGFTRLDANQLERVGEITSLVEDQVEVGVGNNPGAPPPVGSYLLFVKNQVVNMNGLSGYYADVMFENNSKKKAELFSVSSEITESSK